MGEAVEKIAINRSPLDEAHGLSGAQMEARDGWLVPVSYGDVAAEYRAVREEGAGLIDLSRRGRIEIGGTEAVLFLNGLITNDMKTLAENSWMHAAFPNVQGRMLATARVINQGQTFLFDTEAATREQIMKTLGRFTMAGDFSVTDTTLETALISLQGSRASEIVGAVLGEEAANVGRASAVNTSWKNWSLRLIRATHTAEDGFDLFTEASAARSLWDALAAAGARPVGFDALEILRIEAGIPRYGPDMDETKVVLETGLDDAVSFTKGCYIGQEIIARIHFRGHVAKRLAGLLLDVEGQPQPGERVHTPEGKDVGWITSAALSPRLNRSVALGYIKYDYLEVGAPLLIMSDGGQLESHVAKLPFVRGSWYEPEAGSTA